MKGVVATSCLACVFLLVGLIGCEEAPKKAPTDAEVKAPPAKVEEKKAAEETKTAPAEAEEKKPAEKPKAPPAKVEEKKPAEKTEAPPAEAEEKKPGEKTEAPPAKVEEKTTPEKTEAPPANVEEEKPAEKAEAPPAEAEERKAAQAPKEEEGPAGAEKETVVLRPLEGEEEPPPPPKPVLLPFDVEEKVWTIDDFEKESKWRAEAWENANPATVSAAEVEGGKELQVVCEAGESDKSAISRSLPVDMTSRSKLLVDVRSDAEKDIGLAIAFLTQSNAFFESKPAVVKPGLTKDVAFDLKAATYKSAASEWAHTAALAGVDQVKTLYFVIYSGAGETSFDNIRLAAE